MTIPCWLQDLSSDLRLDEVLDRTIENALQACPGREFALLIFLEDSLSTVRTSGLGPGARRRIESWARGCSPALLEPCEIFSLAILGIDQFKQLSDSRGHAAGDTLLRQAAHTIQEACRASDVAARLGGDEFALLLPETNQFESAALCERLRAEIETLAA